MLEDSARGWCSPRRGCGIASPVHPCRSCSSMRSRLPRRRIVAPADLGNTWPTSSTPRARPAGPRGCSCPTPRSPTTSARRREAYGIGAADRVLQFASMSFDTSAEEIYPSLTARRHAGAARRGDGSSLERFAREAGSWASPCSTCPPPTGTSWWPRWGAGWTLPRLLRLVILGGEQAQADRLARGASGWASASACVNSYGPTEATIVTTRRDLTGTAIARATCRSAGPSRTRAPMSLGHGLELVPAGRRRASC